MLNSVSPNVTKGRKIKVVPLPFVIIVCTLLGLIAGSLAATHSPWVYSPLIAWDFGALVFLAWNYLLLHGRNAEETSVISSKENLSRGATDVILILASIVSLGGVGVLLFRAGNFTGLDRVIPILIAIISVLISWAVVHTVYMLKYARLFYLSEGGINFAGENAPIYSDFAYLAFTVGMTFQVSDSTFTNNMFRRLALRHALISYIFSTVIVATTINLIASLGK